MTVGSSSRAGGASHADVARRASWNRSAPFQPARDRQPGSFSFRCARGSEAPLSRRSCPFIAGWRAFGGRRRVAISARELEGRRRQPLSLPRPTRRVTGRSVRLAAAPDRRRRQRRRRRAVEAERGLSCRNSKRTRPVCVVCQSLSMLSVTITHTRPTSLRPPYSCCLGRRAGVEKRHSREPVRHFSQAEKLSLARPSSQSGDRRDEDGRRAALSTTT